MAKKISFEQALEQLEKIVTEIEEGKVSLEESIDKYAQGIQLVKQCRAILDTAEKKIQLLAQGEGETLQESGQLPADEDASQPQGDDAAPF